MSARRLVCRGSWPCGLWLLLLLLSGHQQQVFAATAYLVGSMQQPYEASNSSYNNLYDILQQIDSYNTIVLTEDYAIRNPQQLAQRDPVRLSQDLLITSAPGEQNQLDFAFLQNVVLMNNHTVTLRRIVVNSARKTSGQSIFFFSGEGVLRIQDTLRMRIACSESINATLTALRTAPRPTAFPGTQRVSLEDIDYRGRTYPDSVHTEDVALFVSPGDVEDAAYYAGNNVVQTNVSRLCQSYVPATCNEQCLAATVDAILAARIAGSSSSRTQQLVSTVVPAVVVPVVVLAAAAIAALFWHRRRKAAREALLQKQQQAQQEKLNAQLEEGSAGGWSPAGPGLGKGPGGRGAQLAPHGPGVPVGLLGRSMDMGAVGSIEEVAIGATAENGNRKGWHLMACHTAPEFPEATAKDAITLGVLLGAGSFGRVYRGRWRGLDVAVKVLHHDVNTAASVANEVDLVMSFRHPNITTAYHFLTWNFAHDTGDANTTSGSFATRVTPDPHSAITAATEAVAGAGANGGAIIGPSAATAAGSSAAGPPTPMIARAAPALNSADALSSAPVNSDQQHLSGSSVQRPRLSVIQSQSAGSSAQVTSSAGGSSGHVGVPQQRVSSTGNAAAAAAAGFVGSVQRASSSSSSGSGGRSSISGPLPPGVTTASKLQVEHGPIFGALPLLHTLDSPQRTSPVAPTAAGQAAAQPAVLVDLQAQQATNSTTAASGTGTPVVQSVGSSPMEQVALANGGTLSPESASTGPSWTPSRLTPFWGSRITSPQQQLISGWSTGGGSTSVGQVQSITGAPSEAQQLSTAQAQAVRSSEVSQPQQEQQTIQQEFVPMVPFSGALQQGSQAGAQSGQQAQAQQQRYVPLIQPPQEQQEQNQQQQERITSGTSIPSSPSNISGNLRQQQLQRTARFDPGSGGSSYLGGSKTRSGEAQTWLILEYCDGGTLLDLMQEGLLLSLSTGEINLAHVLTVLADVAAGMNYLHLRNCVHGDLKPANVLLKKQQGAPFGHVAKVSDFGLSKSLTVGQSHRSTRTLGTFNRAPPELLRLGRLSPACDVYAFGVMIWELFTGHVAFSGLHYGEVFERVALLQERPPVPAEMPDALSALMISCWGPDPLARPTFGVIQETIANIMKTLPDSADRFVSDL